MECVSRENIVSLAILKGHTQRTPAQKTQGERATPVTHVYSCTPGQSVETVMERPEAGSASTAMTSMGYLLPSGTAPSATRQ